MNILQIKKGIKQVKKYSVIKLLINFILSRSVEKRFMNFYNPVLPCTNGHDPMKRSRFRRNEYSELCKIFIDREYNFGIIKTIKTIFSAEIRTID